jgi:hypothetical protein
MSFDTSAHAPPPIMAVATPGSPHPVSSTVASENHPTSPQRWVFSLWPSTVHVQPSGLSPLLLERLAQAVLREDGQHRWGPEAWQCRSHDLLQGGLSQADGLNEILAEVLAHLQPIWGTYRYRLSAHIMRCQPGFHVAEHIASARAGLNTVLFLQGDYPATDSPNVRTSGCMVIGNPAKRVNESLLPWETPVHFPITPQPGLLVTMPLCTPHGYFPLRTQSCDTLAIEFHSVAEPEDDHA